MVSRKEQRTRTRARAAAAVPVCDTAAAAACCVWTQHSYLPPHCLIYSSLSSVPCSRVCTSVYRAPISFSLSFHLPSRLHSHCRSPSTEIVYLLYRLGLILILRHETATTDRQRVCLPLHAMPVPRFCAHRVLPRDVTFAICSCVLLVCNCLASQLQCAAAASLQLL